jgi:hypothetical protein
VTNHQIWDSWDKSCDKSQEEQMFLQYTAHLFYCQPDLRTKGLSQCGPTRLVRGVTGQRSAARARRRLKSAPVKGSLLKQTGLSTDKGRRAAMGGMARRTIDSAPWRPRPLYGLPACAGTLPIAAADFNRRCGPARLVRGHGVEEGEDRGIKTGAPIKVRPLSLLS